MELRLSAAHGAQHVQWRIHAGAENMEWYIGRGVPFLPEFIYIVDLEMGTLVHSPALLSVCFCPVVRIGIGADCIGVMGAIATRPKGCGGDAHKLPHKNFKSVFEVMK